MIQDTSLIPFNFGGINHSKSSFEVSSFIIIPVLYDLTTSYLPGSRRGPLAIIEASTHLELYDEELEREVYLAGIHTLPFVEPTTSCPEAMIERVSDICNAVLKSKKIPIMLGGEHSLSIGMVRSLKSLYPNLSVLQLDAHADMRDTYGDSPFNHACVGRRISESCPLTQVGVRSLSSEEASFLKDSGVKTVYAKDLLKQSFKSEVLDLLTEDVYITIDLDVFDPSIMPSVGTPEPGGLTWHDVLGIIREVSSKKRIVGFDVVELSPIPGYVAPDFMAAKLIYRTMGYISIAKDIKY